MRIYKTIHQNVVPVLVKVNKYKVKRILVQFYVKGSMFILRCRGHQFKLLFQKLIEEFKSF